MRKSKKQNPNQIDVLKKWRFFHISNDAFKQCVPTSKGCMCGPKARCFTMNTEAPTGTGDDEFVRELVERRVLYPMFHLLDTHLTSYLHRYCKATGKRYGRDVVLSLKGGNVFAILMHAFLKCMRRDMSILTDIFADACRLGDLDFEVCGDLDNNEVRDVAKLSAMALYDVRISLQETVMSHLRRKKSDNVVMSVDNGPKSCPQCNVLFMPVPSVLRSVEGAWYRPETVFGELTQTMTSLPISYNTTLKRLFGADVILLRMKAVVGEKQGEIYDISIPFHTDPIHAHLMKHSCTWFFKTTDEVHIASTRYFLYTLRHTFFLENIAVWNVFKLAKKMVRYILCLIMVCVIDEKHTLEDALDACRITADILADRYESSLSHVKPFDEFLQDMKNTVEQFGDNVEFRREIAGLFEAIATRLHGDYNGTVTKREFQKHLNVRATVTLFDRL